MTPQEQTLLEQVYLPAFTEKCAAAGLDLSDPSTLSDALDTVALVKQMQQTNGNNVVKTAAAELKAALGIDKQDVVDGWAANAKQAAAKHALNPAIQEALFGSNK